MLKKINDFIKDYSILLGIGLLFIVCAIPLVFFLFYLRGKNKTIKIIPKFEVIDIVDSSDTDLTVLEDAVEIGKDVLKKVKENK